MRLPRHLREASTNSLGVTARRSLTAVSVAAGGLALASAFPPNDWEGLAWVALVPAFVVAATARPAKAFGWGWLGSFAFFLPLLHWLNFTFATYSSIPWPLTWGPTMLLAGYCALWPAAVSAAVSWVARRRGVVLALTATPFLWAAAEWGRGHLMSGFPWGLIGYSQYAHLRVIQIAELGGVYAVSFVIVTVNATLAAAVTLPRRRALGAAAIGAVIVVGTMVFGTWRLATIEAGPTVAVAIMQPSIEQPLKYDPRFTSTTLGVYFALTRSLLPGGAQLVVWPETSAPTVLRQDPALQRALESLSAAVGAPLLVGSVDVDTGLRNTAFLLDERGLRGRYDKMQLVPFGEYVPLARLIGFVRTWAEFISEMEPGSRAVVFPGPPVPFGVVICYEGIFPDLVRSFVRGGARLVINMTNDGWFGRTSGPQQHLTMYSFRAVEHRVSIVRSANTGVSAFIAPTGRIVRRLGLFERGIMTDRVSVRSVDTLYTRLGDWVVYVGFVVSGLVLIMAGRERETVNVR